MAVIAETKFYVRHGILVIQVVLIWKKNKYLTFLSKGLWFIMEMAYELNVTRIYQAR
jgi:hypothetical protein